MRRGGQHSLLVELIAFRIAIDPGGAAIDDPFDTGAPHRLQDVEGATDVDRFRFGRVLQHVLHVRDRGQVKDHVDRVHRHPQRLGIHQTAMIELDIIAPGWVHHVVDTDDNLPVTELVDQVRADEA